MFCRTPLALLLLATSSLAQAQPPDQGARDPRNAKEDPSVADFVAFERWLQDYQHGAFRLVKHSVEDPEALAQLQATLANLARWNNLVAARKLFEAAAIVPPPPEGLTAAARFDWQRELQPAKVRALARAALVRMQCAELDPWLVRIASWNPSAQDPAADSERRNAAIQVLGARGGIQGMLALLEASGTYPVEERVRAIHALGEHATLELVPHLIDLVAQAEPNARIAAINGLGRALREHTDETRGKTPPPEVAKQRDQVVKRLQDVLLVDRIWQVRAAAADALASLRCKAVMPALIAGLKAETARTRDPWAMDMRLHRLLEGLTGQKLPVGKPAIWEEFWKKEGPAFAFTDSKKVAQASQKEGGARYQKFFAIDLESDRVLFVLDFSGSMAEEVTLQSGTTAAAAGTKTTKARLVIAELKRIVAALPDRTELNFVVFSDDVRTWREGKDGRPLMVRLDDDARDELLSGFLDSLHPQGSTNLYGALDRALDFAGRGLYDKYYATAFDTLYVLSDGAPSAGKTIDTDEIRKLVREANGLKRMTIHTVTFGDKNETNFLGKLAEENGGRHIHVE